MCPSVMVSELNLITFIRFYVQYSVTIFKSTKLSMSFGRIIDLSWTIYIRFDFNIRELNLHYYALAKASEVLFLLRFCGRRLDFQRHF
jgi:hypothetical protein